MTGRAALPEVVADDPRLAGLSATSADGLSEEEVRSRAAAGLANDFVVDSSRSYRDILRENALTTVNVLLSAISLALVLLGLYGDAAVTIVLVVVNIVVGVLQEARAKRSLDRLSILTRPTATVVRAGQRHTVEPARVVLGDLLHVGLGDQLLLDGRLVEGSLEVDESLLTGEADRIPKGVGDEVLSGSFCVSGAANYLVTRVGADTFANRLTTDARAYRHELTPIQRDVARVMRAMSLLVALAAVPVAVGLWLDFGTLPPVETTRAAAVLVALVPQGLVVMVTVTYALAIVRLAGDKALIQRSSAVESMSRVDVLCLDKTGTLTTPYIELAEARSFVDEATLQPAVGDFLHSATLATRSADALRAVYGGRPRPVREEVTFSSELRWSGLRFESGEAYALGAPEVLLPLVSAGGAEAQQQVNEWAADGLRVMVLAAVPESESLNGADQRARLPAGLRLLATFALREQLRADARETLAAFGRAGVTLKLISGDNPATVAALSRQVGLVFDGDALSGLSMAELDDAELADAVERATVFGRVPPSLKARLVVALRGRGHWVGMIGDGVNDVLSLKQAQLGVSMQSGSQATRAVADIVLLDDSFAALPEAVIEGQRIIGGMQDSMHLFLARAMYMSLVILGAALAGLAMPVSPRHNTVLALITVGIPVIFLAVWARPARPGLDSLRRVLRLITPPAVACAALALPLYGWYSGEGSVDLARTAFTTFAVFCGLLLLPLLEPPIGESLSGADADGADVRPTLLALALLAVYALFFGVPPVREFFELVPLRWVDVGLIGGLALLWAVLVMIFWRSRLYDRAVGLLRRAMRLPESAG